MTRSITFVTLLALLLGFLAPCAMSQVAVWSLSGTIDSTNPFPVTATAGDVAAGPLSRAAPLTPRVASNAFLADGWPSGGFDPSRYFEFSVTAAAGFRIDYQSVDFSLYNNFNGSSDWSIRTSVDGFATDIASGVATAIAGGGEAIQADVSSLGSLSGKVVFRLYTFSNSGSVNPVQRGLRGTLFGGIDLSVTGTVIAIPVTILDPGTAYIEDFESGTGAWSPQTSPGSSWDFCRPGGTTIGSAHSGQRAFAVDCGVAYVNFTSTSLEATFDFSSFPADPLFKMWIWYDAEAGWDGVNVEVDTGSGFTVLGAVGDPLGWYIDSDVGALGSDVDGWSGASGGWVQAAHALDGVAGGVATIRINFGSDAVITAGNGAAVDDIRIVTAPIVVVPGAPYFDDFESGPGGWQVSGEGSVWELGTPQGSFINSAFSGVQAFATDLDSDYVNATRTGLERTFDFTSLVDDPTFTMKLWYDAEFGWDGVNVEMDVGTGFALVGAETDLARNWYDSFLNAQLADGWSGSSPDWFTAAHALDGAAGNVATVRINFASDNVVEDGNGAAVDLVTIIDGAARYGGTGEDLVTFRSVGAGTPVEVDDSVTDEVDLVIGDFLAIDHASPGGTFVGLGDFLVIGSLGAVGLAPVEVLPGLHLGTASAFLVTPSSIPGIGPLKLTAAGYGYGFQHPGGAASGLSVFFQAIVIHGSAANMIYATTDALEVRMN